jgi:hypothetical protein
MEQVDTHESWNKKKIFVAVFLLALLIAGGILFKVRILGQNSESTKSVKGIGVEQKNAEPETRVNIQEVIGEKLNNLKQEVSGLDVMEIASSSPQVQKIINDIKSLEQYPTNQVKEICRKICGL